MEKDKPIYQRPASATQSRKSIPLPAKFSQEDIERKQLQHNEDYLFERRWQPVFVKFHDGEEIRGTVNRIRKFTFVIDTDEHGSVMVYKVGVKYVREAKG
jgi:sRNA-binding regulator protein Hfq